MKLHLYHVNQYSILYICLFLAICFSSCSSQRKLADTIIVNEDDTMNNTKNQDLIPEVVQDDDYLIEILRNGKLEGDFYSYLDTVPEILYKVFPQLIFVKLKQIGSIGSGFWRGWAYYNNSLNMVNVEFNFYLKNMQYVSLPNFEEKALALLVILENYNRDIEIQEIEYLDEMVPYREQEFNYRIIAKINNQNEEYLLLFNNEQFISIAKVSSDVHLAIEPAVY